MERWRVVASGGRDPASTSEGIQLDETAAGAMELEWSKGLG